MRAAWTGASRSARRRSPAHDGALYEETYNLLNAWLAVVPGNGAHNLRRLALLNTNVADLSFLFTLDTGAAHERASGGREYLAVFETEHQTPYFWNLHVRRRRARAGARARPARGSRSSLNFLVTHAQKYDPITVDLRSRRQLREADDRCSAAARGGWACRIATSRSIRSAWSRRRSTCTSCSRSCACCCSRAGSTSCTMTDDRDLYEAIENLYALDRAAAAPDHARQHAAAALGQHLHRWVQGGPYAALFDNAEDTLTFQRVQCFDFEGLDKFPLRPGAVAVLRPAPGERGDPGPRRPAPRSSSSCSTKRGASREDATRQGVHHRGAQDVAQAQRRR